MKLYRKIKASERLPEEEGWYFCTWADGTHSEEEYINNEFYVSEYDTENHDEITDWLEEIEITEEEIYKILYDNMIDYKFTSIGDSVDFKLWKSAKEILKLFKEDKK